MRPSRQDRAVAGVLRCYPAKWRSRHEEEATLLASALREDGVPWWSIALSFLGGAARARILRKPNLRVGVTMAAATIAFSAIPLALFASLTPANAANTNVTVLISNLNDAAGQLEAVFARHHFQITVAQMAVPMRLAGSIVSFKAVGRPDAGSRVVSRIHGRCADGTTGCVDGLVLPLHFSGQALLTVGRMAANARARSR
jgi:hypothetical protein